MFNDAWNKTLSQLAKEYHEEVNSIAEGFISEFGPNPWENEETDEALHHHIDGHAAVIYTFQAQIVQLLSNSDLADLQDELGDLTSESAKAYVLMMSDVQKAINRKMEK
jgi:protoheme ferro-lyase